MTRAHARLLGPCFKTGPESTQSYSVADGRVQGLSERAAATAGTVAASAPGPITAITSELAADRTRTGRGPAPTSLPSSVPAGQKSPVRTLRREPNARAALATLRPAPNGSQRPTREEVHAFGDCTADRGRGYAEAHRRTATSPNLPKRG